jgi:quercetin dioxygenase-like cupin family protein
MIRTDVGIIQDFVRSFRQFRVFAVIALTSFMGGAVTADSQPITRTLLEKFDVSGHLAQECVFGLAELEPGASIGRHFHHGVEAGYVLAGQLELEIEGEGTRLLKAGGTYQIAAGKIHDARNTGSSTARVNAVWVIEKNKPLSQPAD